MTDPQQQSPQQASDTLIGLYVWADLEWTNSLGKAFNRIRDVNNGYQFDTAVRFLQRQSQRIVNLLDRQTPPLLKALEHSVQADAVGRVQRIPPKPPIGVGLLQPPEPPKFDFTIPLGERATDAIHLDLRTELKDIRARILRQPNDLYKLTAAGAATHSVMANGDTIQVAQQRMMQDLIQHGVTGFTDNAGRNWQLSSYVEMAVRTATIRALNEAHMTVMQASGITLFTIPVHVHTCPICHEWQGKILSIEPDERADATIAEAREAGLWHPNCEHVITSWNEGDSHVESTTWTEQDEELWNASQRQRSLERSIRGQKRVLAASPSPEMRLAAKKRIRKYQAEIRMLTDKSGLLRRRRREQLDIGLRH